MTAMYIKVADWIRNKEILWFYWLALWAGFIGALYLGWVDLNTSMLGYDLLPVAKYNNTERFFIALMPQLVQILSGYLYLGLIHVSEDENSKIKIRAVALLVFLAFALADIASDVYFRSNAISNWPSFIVSVSLTIVFFTLGSEVLLTFTSSMLKQLNEDGWIAFKEFLMGIFKVLTGVVETVVEVFGLLLNTVGKLLGVIVGVFIRSEKPQNNKRQSGNYNRNQNRKQTHQRNVRKGKLP